MSPDHPKQLLCEVKKKKACVDSMLLLLSVQKRKYTHLEALSTLYSTGQGAGWYEDKAKT